MSYTQKIAKLLTEDPDVFAKNVVLAVHPNFVVDAVVYASEEKDYAPHRLNMLKNYINRFKRFIDGQISSDSTVIITMMGTPTNLGTWHDPKNPHEKNVDLEKSGMEQKEVFELHQGMIDYIYNISSGANVHVVSEISAGNACRTGRLDDMLEGASEINVIGGHLAGCLAHTVEALKKKEGSVVNIIAELTFDQHEDFWERAYQEVNNS